MSFQQGLSGLNASAKSLDVIGNNIANASTVGFKGSQAQFADVYANSLSGAAGNQAGIGVKVAQIAQQFNQGNIESSANPLDMAISGAGFFRTEINGAVQYTRNGQFSLDKDGFMVNAQGAKLTGYLADTSGKILAGAPAPLKIDNADLTPKATTTIDVALNLDSRSVAPDPAINPFLSTDTASFNKQSSIDVYDSLGNAHLMSTYYVKSFTATNTWDVYTAIDGAEPGAASGQLTFDTNGILTTSPASLSFDLTITPDNGATLVMPVVMGFTGSTQYGAVVSEKVATQNGYTAGHLANFTAGADGIIVGQYSNGQTHALGQVVLVNFTNPNGLTPLGNNAWTETSASGVPLPGVPNSGSLGVIQASAVESSNVDLTAELVNMITAQRGYQANAQTIKTQDQIMQTLVNLR